jgi:hypothetical protein
MTRANDSIDQKMQAIGGLTKREHFAALFLQEIISKTPSTTTYTIDEAEQVFNRRARGAVGYADALIKALNEPATT